MLDSFLKPINSDIVFASDQLPGSLANHVRIHHNRFPDLNGVKLAIFGVMDERLNGYNAGASQAANHIRQALYRLMVPKTFFPMADIGNVVAGDTADDTRFAIQTVLNELKHQNICALIIGGDESLALQQFYALKGNNVNIELTYCGRQISLREGQWANKVVLDESSNLFNLNAIGYQSYLTEQESIDVMERLFFEPVRLGTLRSRMSMAEPYYRSSHISVFDCGAIRSADFPGVREASPNGLYNEEACQLARYAGLSHACESVGFYNYIPALDRDEVCARQVAQMIWYFVEAFAQRKEEFPLKNGQSEQFITYRLDLKGSHELVFYKSRLTDRWWMSIPHPKKGLENTLPLVVPCEYEDYITASTDELPDRWWRFYQKYSV